MALKNMRTDARIGASYPTYERITDAVLSRVLVRDPLTREERFVRRARLRVDVHPVRDDTVDETPLQQLVFTVDVDPEADLSLRSAYEWLATQPGYEQAEAA